MRCCRGWATALRRTASLASHRRSVQNNFVRDVSARITAESIVNEAVEDTDSGSPQAAEPHSKSDDDNLTKAPEWVKILAITVTSAFVALVEYVVKQSARLVALTVFAATAGHQARLRVLAARNREAAAPRYRLHNPVWSRPEAVSLRLEPSRLPCAPVAAPGVARCVWLPGHTPSSASSITWPNSA
jgi:hypothetical protein